MNRLTPATLDLTEAGVPYSAAFDDVYHSADGGLGQARHVFMTGNDLPAAWAGRDAYTIVETGFGQGLNFLATWQAWRSDAARCQRLHFVSVEQFPFTRDDLAVLHARYPELATVSAELRAYWPDLTQGVHRIWLDQGRVSLTLLLGDAQTLLPQLQAVADAIYLDGFSPAKNPELWCLPIYKALWRLSHVGTTLATYTVAGEVRRGLAEAGFAVERVNGFGGKRQMLQGRVARAPRREPASQGQRHALVIGAGLAGCSVAERLAVRGWQVTVLEAANDIATGSSGNAAGLMHAYYSRDDNLQARLTRAGCALTRQHLTALADAGFPVAHDAGGILQLAKTDAQAVLMREIAEHGRWPALRYLDADAAGRLAGTTLARGGWWFTDGLTIAPPSLCRANLARHAERISLRIGCRVEALRQHAGGWQALAADGSVVAAAAVLVLANATAAAQLLPKAMLPLQDAQRVATRINAATLTVPRVALAGDGYVTAALDGVRVIGAADFDDNLAAAEASNLAELAALVPGLAPPSVIASRICARPASPDRLPLIGQLAITPPPEQPVHQLYHLPRLAGAYAVLGLGARGLSYSTLAGELIAAQLNGEPLPLERKLLEAIDPGRFLLRQRRGMQPG
ncbi:bifunctional tRNA (5-methylaminomethyl-2-thiouridine)(34)-methyltransferase MnmD/FAD-dependent 5-carboxymethylaminomethyl-2-thiouridine(34) oxidoreductase MnmC [Chitinolyticbacter meiyuanensis]|uniref:bifunctional tRNA (5-methylaminomethyl-2-thiouridine)(34)-methyltransferase MnmD/FAD-dependent 5-carboxymethylaminomethyl-2-thiouridine(34) oxidoreductase MnmC n=1 Tax=Chitinolyticbacter meiyuanensis TaxID=682798 RepID=UPI0011E5AFCA|nr:bifunctional tRNA (5-methylaminomethyl-2-thiouridine)(34)-methyltransferase MnmD/FAD-dependent 5-carboxymethylaminomethyl-2-thiouridine(34) oxidoreductase MnmC [Chitinolyticbacter meiyuanensis]